MAKRYNYETTVCLDTSGDYAYSADFDVKVEFSVAWGSPPSGEYGPPENYDPGSDSVVEDVKIVSVEGLTEGWGKAFTFGYQTDAQVAADMVEALDFDDLLVSAREEEADAAIHAEEERAEHRREDLREGW